MYQLCLGSAAFSTVIDQITARACAAAPGLDPDACRRLLELVFASRIRQTAACGRFEACQPGAPVWGGPPAPAGKTCGWQDLDPHGLPAMFGASAADLAHPAADRAEVARRLAVIFRAVVADLLFENPRCGRSEVCLGAPVFPRLRDDAA